MLRNVQLEMLINIILRLGRLKIEILIRLKARKIKAHSSSSQSCQQTVRSFLRWSKWDENKQWERKTIFLGWFNFDFLRLKKNWWKNPFPEILSDCGAPSDDRTAFSVQEKEALINASVISVKLSMNTTTSVHSLTTLHSFVIWSKDDLSPPS